MMSFLNRHLIPLSPNQTVKKNEDGTAFVPVTLAPLADLLSAYPIGSIYTSVNSTSPSVLFGGTWVSFGSGRVLVGIESDSVEFDTVEKTGGSKTHTLTVNEIPAHTHTYTQPDAPVSAIVAGVTLDSLTRTANVSSGSTGGGASHNNLQPYIVVYIFKRTA